MATYLDPEEALFRAYQELQSNDPYASRRMFTNAAGFAPGAGVLEALGMFPSPSGGYEPSLGQNISQGNLGSALLQLLGAGGDAALATGVLAPIGLGMKTVAQTGKALKAGSKAAKATPKAPRMSAAEAREAGYWHNIGAGKRLPIPISQMTAEREPVRGLLDRITIDAEKMQGGSIIPFVGDRSIAGQNLLGIGGYRFDNPVYLEGGYDFMRTHSPEGTVWASNQGAAQALQNRINKAAGDFSGDVYGVYSAMGPLAMDYNVMMADALFEQIKNSKITKKAMQEFDKELRAVRPEWKGIGNPESRAQLEANGALRTAFVDRMQLDKFQDANFPNIAYTRWALTDPKLLNEPMYSSGLAIGRMSPGADLVLNPVTPHKTYDSQLRGQYMGGFDQSIPREIMFPDWYRQRRVEGRPESGDTYSFMRAKPIQQTNQQWLDGIMNYLGR